MAKSTKAEQKTREHLRAKIDLREQLNGHFDHECFHERGAPEGAEMIIMNPVNGADEAHESLYRPRAPFNSPVGALRDIEMMPRPSA